MPAPTPAWPPAPPFTQLHASVLPRQAAVALARLTSLCSLKLQASDLAEAVVDSALGLPGLTRLSIFTPRGLLPAQHLAELPQRLPLLVHLKLGEGVVQGPPLEDAQLPAPADFPHLRTYEFNFDFDQRRRFKVITAGCWLPAAGPQDWARRSVVRRSAGRSPLTELQANCGFAALNAMRRRMWCPNGASNVHMGAQA